MTKPKRKTKKKDRWWRGVIHVSQNPPFLYHHPILPTQKHNSPVQPFRCALSFNQKKKDVHCPFGQTRRRRDLKERELWKKKRSRRRRRDLEEEEEKEEIWKKDRSVANCFLFFLFFSFFFLLVFLLLLRLIFFFRPEHPIQPKPVQPLRFAILMVEPPVSGFWPIFLNFRFFQKTGPDTAPVHG